MKQKNNPIRLAGLILAGTACLPVHAVQTKPVRDGMAVEVIVADSEPTRIRVEGAKITDVFGNIHSSSCAPKADPSPAAAAAAAAVASTTPAVNPSGEFVLGCDMEKGEIFISPVPRSAAGSAAPKPINIFVSTDKATYTLRLRRADVPADTIVLVDAANRASGNGPRVAKSSQHVRSLKDMLLVMAGTRTADDITSEAVNQEQLLWQETRLLMVRQFRGRGLVGEEYRLTNVSTQSIVLAEQEFDRPGAGVLAVAIENLNLRPNESTSVFVIRAGE